MRFNLMRGKSKVALLAVLVLVMMLVPCMEVQAASRGRVKAPQPPRHYDRDAVIMYLNRPAGSWIGATRADIYDSFDFPEAYARRGAAARNNSDSYGDITFIYNTASKPDTQTFCTKITIRTGKATVNGHDLRRNYDGLVRLLGNPSSTKHYPRTQDRRTRKWNPAYYEVKFNLSDRNGKNLVATFTLDNLRGSVADRVTITRR